MSDNTESKPEVIQGRNDIRAKIFGTKPKTDEFVFFGAKVELRQPDLGTILEQRQQSQETQTFTMLLNFTFVPGTNEKVFEEADVEALKGLPFGEDMQEFIQRVQKLLGLKVEQIEGDIKSAEKSA